MARFKAVKQDLEMVVVFGDQAKGIGIVAKLPPRKHIVWPLYALLHDFSFVSGSVEFSDRCVARDRSEIHLCAC